MRFLLCLCREGAKQDSKKTIESQPMSKTQAHRLSVLKITYRNLGYDDREHYQYTNACKARPENSLCEGMPAIPSLFGCFIHLYIVDHIHLPKILL